MKIKKIILSGLILATIGAVVGCGNKQDVKKDENTPVRIAFFPNITHSQALIGRETGTFQKALGDKNKIEWKQFNAGSSEIEALLAGAIDIGYIGPGPAINGYTKSKGDIQIIAGATDAGAILVSRKDLKLSTVKELDGKKIAIPQFGNTQDLSLRYLLGQNGLKDKTKGGSVEIVQAENPDIKTLLDKGEIDGALVPEPWGSRLIKEVGANLVLDFDKIWRQGKYPTAVIVVRKDFLKAHGDIVEKFLKAHVELTSYINKNTEEASKLINKQVKELTKSEISKEILDSSFKRLTITNDPEIIATNEMVDLSVTTGFLKSKPDTNNLFNLELLNKVLKEKGEKIIQ